jgi:hypothetical protein
MNSFTPKEDHDNYIAAQTPDEREAHYLSLLTAATRMVQAYDSDDLTKIAEAVDHLQDVLEGRDA